MDAYVTGAAIRRLREARALTQAQLAEKLDVSSKTVSKWETGRGLPDICMLEPLCAALGVSMTELLSGSAVVNRNRCANLLRAKFYVCPICGNVIHTMGDAVVSCCGVSLPALEAEPVDEAHAIRLEPVEDETFLSIDHPMAKSHFISFAACVTPARMELIRFYPEGDAQCRLRLPRRGVLYLYCNRHGLMQQTLAAPPAGGSARASILRG